MISVQVAKISNFSEPLTYVHLFAIGAPHHVQASLVSTRQVATTVSL